LARFYQGYVAARPLLGTPNLAGSRSSNGDEFSEESRGRVILVVNG